MDLPQDLRQSIEESLHSHAEPLCPHHEQHEPGFRQGQPKGGFDGHRAHSGSAHHGEVDRGSPPAGGICCYQCYPYYYACSRPLHGLKEGRG